MSEDYKNFAITAAKELYYPNAVISKLKKANTDAEIQRIMCTARNAY